MQAGLLEGAAPVLTAAGCVLVYGGATSDEATVDVFRAPVAARLAKPTALALDKTSNMWWGRRFVVHQRVGAAASSPASHHLQVRPAVASDIPQLALLAAAPADVSQHSNFAVQARALLQTPGRLRQRVALGWPIVTDAEGQVLGAPGLEVPIADGHIVEILPGLPALCPSVLG